MTKNRTAKRKPVVVESTDEIRRVLGLVGLRAEARIYAEASETEADPTKIDLALRLAAISFVESIVDEEIEQLREMVNRSDTAPLTALAQDALLVLRDRLLWMDDRIKRYWKRERQR